MSALLGYAWRKYDVARPVYGYEPDLLDPGFRGLVLWHGVSTREYPRLNRWEKLDAAFMGFMSRGIDAPHACVYDAGKAIEIMSREHLAKTWIPGADAAEAYEHFCANFLGVWMGEKTPYFFHPTVRLVEIVKNI